MNSDVVRKNDQNVNFPYMHFYIIIIKEILKYVTTKAESLMK